LACVVALLLTAALTPAARAAKGAGELAPATLTVSPASQTVTDPGWATLSGSVSVADAQLALLRQRAGETDWTPLRTLVAGPHGAFTLTVAPPVNTDYKLAFAGDADHGGVEAVVTVHVRPRMLTDFPTSLWLGGAVTLRGSVAPAHGEGTVVIERLVDGAWQALATAPLGAASKFAYRWTPSTFGYFRLRARMEADAEHVAGRSAASRVIVNRPNAHNVPYKFEHFIVIVVHEYKLYYYEHGENVRIFNVALGRPGYRTPIGRFHIYSKRRPAGGALGACAMFYRQQGGIAIHGTDQPWLLRRFPRPFSHGCARMYNSQALWLYSRCPHGTPVHNIR
jgi:lipoprotein-anchoring transpeptidase ErfK/SrfK